MILIIIGIGIWHNWGENKDTKVSSDVVGYLSTGIYGVTETDSLQIIKDAGFKTVFYDSFPWETDQKISEFLNKAEELDLKVVLSGIGFWQIANYKDGYHNFNYEEAHRKLIKFSKESGVIGFYPYDEASGNYEKAEVLLPKLQKVYRFTKKTASHLLIITAEGNPEIFIKKYAPHAQTYFDFILFDFYPYKDNSQKNQWYNQKFGYNTVNSTEYMLSQIVKTLGNKIPWGGVIQAHDYPGNFSFPPKENFYNQGFLYQKYGAKALWYFAYNWGKQPKERSPISKLEGWNWISDMNNKFTKGEKIDNYFFRIRTNLIKNGEFNGTVGWEILSSVNQYIMDKELIFKGKGKGVILRVWQDIQVQPGVRYGIMAQFKTDSINQQEGIEGRVDFYDKTGNKVGQSIIIAGGLKTPDYVWQRRELISPADSKRARIILFYHDMDNIQNHAYVRKLAFGPILIK